MDNKQPIIAREHVNTAIAIAILTPSIAFIFSFFYDLGIFIALGISYADAPTSIVDHMRTGLVWFPPTIIIVAIIIALELLNASMNGGDSGLVESPDSHKPSKSKISAVIITWIVTGVYAVCTLLGVIGFLLWLLYGDDYPVNMFYFGASFLWVLIAFIGVVRLDKLKRQSRLLRFIFVSWPLFPLIFIHLGQWEAIRDSRSTQKIHISDKQSASVLEDVNIVRAYGDWLLVRSQQDKVFWVKLDNVDRIDILNEKSFKGLRCLISKDSCTPSENRNEPGES